MTGHSHDPSWYGPEQPGRDYELHKAAAEEGALSNSLSSYLGRELLPAEEQELAEAGVVQGRLRSNMSDLEIVNEIIRIAGYERVAHISAMLLARWGETQRS